MRVIVLLCWLALPAGGLLYQVDQPVPVSLGHGEYWAEARLWGSGGVLLRLAVGLFERVTLGMSYGGNRIIGNDSVQLFDRWRPDFQARLALLREAGYVPDLVLGFDSQGYDDCVRGRFLVREPGVYLAAGKTVDVTRSYFQLAVSYQQGLNGSVAVSELLPGGLELIAEYDPALNDRTDRGRGFLNAGLAWTVDRRVRLGFALRDILGNRVETVRNRVFSVALVNRF